MTEKHWLANSYLEAKTYGPEMSTPPKLLVVHTAETPEMGNSAEGVANYFHNGAARRVLGKIVYVKASTTWCVDNNSVVQCVPLGHVNYGAPGANHNGEHMELAGRAAQSAKEWSDPYSLAQLHLAARLFGVRSSELGIPLAYLRAADLLASKTPTGVTTHAEVTKAYKRSTHTDPGPNFPMSWFLVKATEYRHLHERAGSGKVPDGQARKEILRLTGHPFPHPLVRWDGGYTNGLTRSVVWIKSIAEAQALLDLGYVQRDWEKPIAFRGDKP